MQEMEVGKGSMDLVSKEQFLAYERVRVSGSTNMFDIQTVIMRSGRVLNKEVILAIMKHYSELKDKYV